jgi:hypothetical protein
MSATASELSQRGRIGAHESWARTKDRAQRTAPARARFLERFEKYPDPESARKAYFARLALASAKARRLKKVSPPEDAA